MARAILVVAILALAAPAAASAATARVVEHEEGDSGGSETFVTFEYSAAPGETNELTVTGAAGAVVFTDSGAAIAPGRGCTAVTPGEVRCEASPGASSEEAAIRLGDGADRLTVDASSGVQVSVEGEGGADRLDAGALGQSAFMAGGNGADELIGGTAGDALDGGRGEDQLMGGAGADTLLGDTDSVAVAADAIDGGEGRDTVTYQGYRLPVLVDLEHPETAGAAGEGDRLTSIEDVQGGRAPSRLLGDAGPNFLRGTGRLSGRGGDDVLLGGLRRDRLDGGDGDDVIDGVQGGDAIECGPGDDHVRPPGVGPERGAPFVPLSCELVEPFWFSLGPLRATGGLLRTRALLQDPDSWGGAVSVRLPGHRARPGALVARGRWRWQSRRRDARQRLALELSPAGRAAARRHAVVVVRALGFLRCFGLPFEEGGQFWRTRL